MGFTRSMMARDASLTGLRPRTASWTSSRKVACARAASGKGGKAARAVGEHLRLDGRERVLSQSARDRHRWRRAPGPLPLNAMPSVTRLLDTSLMKLQASALSLAFFGITIAQASTTEAIGVLPLSAAETGNSTALILPAILALLGIVELSAAGERQHGESGPSLLDPGDLIVILGRGVAARQCSGLEHGAEAVSSALSIAAGSGTSLKSLVMKSPPKARANITGKTARSLASTMPVTGVPALEVKVSFFDLLDQFLQRLRRRRNAGLLKQRLVVEQALRCVAHRDADQLAADRHALHEARRDIAEILDRDPASDRSSSGSNSGGDLGRSAGCRSEADAVIGLVQARLAEETVLQRVGVEGGEGDLGIVRALRQAFSRSLSPRAEHGLVDLVAEDVERLGRAPRTGPAASDGRATAARCRESRGGSSLVAGLVRHGYLPPFSTVHHPFVAPAVRPATR